MYIELQRARVETMLHIPTMLCNCQMETPPSIKSGPLPATWPFLHETQAIFEPRSVQVDESQSLLLSQQKLKRTLVMFQGRPQTRFPVRNLYAEASLESFVGPKQP